MEPPWKPPTKPSIRRVHELLVQLYGTRTPVVRDPLDGLILIILSQATNDINCDRAFNALKSRYPTWEEVAAAPVEEIANTIRAGGLANQKAARIRQMLVEMQAESGTLDLAWMHGASAQECINYLSKFHGVGPKTIACVLVFFLNKPAFPVDTHVHRVTKRLGWIRPQAGAEEAHRVLEVAIPDELKLDLHVNFITHGRMVCRADGNGGPRCGECVLRPHCKFGKSLRLRKNDLTAPANETTAKGDFFVTLKARHHKPHAPIEKTDVDHGSAQ